MATNSHRNSWIFSHYYAPIIVIIFISVVWAISISIAICLKRYSHGNAACARKIDDSSRLDIHRFVLQKEHVTKFTFSSICLFCENWLLYSPLFPFFSAFFCFRCHFFTHRKKQKEISWNRPQRTASAYQPISHVEAVLSPSNSSNQSIDRIHLLCAAHKPTSLWPLFLSLSIY